MAIINEQIKRVIKEEYTIGNVVFPTQDYEEILISEYRHRGHSIRRIKTIDNKNEETYFTWEVKTKGGDEYVIGETLQEAKDWIDLNLD